MSPVMSKRDLKELRDFVDGVERSNHARLIAAIDAALKTKKFVRLARARKATKKEQAQGEWAIIRGLVLDRAHGHCENCRVPSERLAADHMFGGSGRRKTLESIYTVWALCFLCDQQKTRSRSLASYWLEKFIQHCSRCSDVPASQYDVPGMAGYVYAASIAQRRLDSIRISEALPHGRKTK